MKRYFAALLATATFVLFAAVTGTAFAEPPTKVLLVVDSATNAMVAPYKAALDKSKFSYRVHSLATDGRLTSDLIYGQKGGVILWAGMTRGSVIGDAEANTLADFMLSGGAVWLAGSPLGAVTMDGRLAELLMAKRGATPTNLSVSGVQYDLISHGLSFAIKGVKDAADARIPDWAVRRDAILEPFDKAEPILHYGGNRDAVAAVRVQTCAYRLVYCGFGIDEIADAAKRDAFVYKTLDWFFGNTMGIGQQAPDFLVTKLDGSSSTFYAETNPYAENKVMLLEFWATWCSYCANERPILAKIVKDYKSKGVEVVGVSYRENTDLVNKYIADHPETGTWNNYLDVSGRGGQKCGLKGLPHILIVDGARKVQFIGNFTSEPTLRAELDRALAAERERVRTEAVLGRVRR